MSRVEERSSENWRGVRIGLRVFVAGSWEGKMEMWRGLFCGKDYRSVLNDCSFGVPRGRGCVFLQSLHSGL